MNMINFAADVIRQAKKQRKLFKETMPDGEKMIDINYSIPYVCVKTNTGKEFYFQGEDAEAIIEDAKSNIELNKYCSIEEILIYQSMGWGQN